MNNGTKKCHTAALILLNILMVVVILACIAGKTAGVYVSQGVLEISNSDYVTSQAAQAVIGILDYGTNGALSGIQSDIEQSDEVASIAAKYTDAFVDGIWENKEFSELDVDISEDVSSLINKVASDASSRLNLSSVAELLLNKAVTSQQTNVENAVKSYVSDIYDSVRTQAELPVKLYYVITSQAFFIATIVLMVLLAVLIFMAAPVSVLKIAEPVVCVVTGVLYYLLVNVVLNRIVIDLGSKYIGRTASLATEPGQKVLIIMCVIAVAVFAVLALADAYMAKREK